MPNEHTPKKQKKQTFRLDFNSRPKEMTESISRVFEKLLGNSSKSAIPAEDATTITSATVTQDATLAEGATVAAYVIATDDNTTITSATVTQDATLAEGATVAAYAIATDDNTATTSATVTQDATLAEGATMTTRAGVTQGDTPTEKATVTAYATVAHNDTANASNNNARGVPFKKGETFIPNLILDGLGPILDPTVLLTYLRLFRLSHGFKSETCIVGVFKLSKSLNLGARTIQRSILQLERLGLVKRLGAHFGKDLKGNAYLVRLPSVSKSTCATVTDSATVTRAAISNSAPTPLASAATVASSATVAQVISVSPVKGETRFPNFLLDGIPPLFDYSVTLTYLRLFQLSHGRQSDHCTIGVAKLAASLNLGDRTVQRAILRLETVGLVKRVNSNFGNGVKGNTYFVGLPTFSEESPAMLDVPLATSATMTRSVTVAHNRHDDHDQRKNHHQSARARAGDDDETEETETAHFADVKRLYQELTGNAWKAADTAAYREIADVPVAEASEALRRVAARSPGRANSFRYFVREIKAGPETGMAEREVTTLVEVAREVRSLNTGRYGYTEAEFREDVKAAAARRGAAYGPSVLEEALRRLVGGRTGG
jgi:predicted transcriptional regulator